MTKAALYARISRDKVGREKGVQRQLEDCRHLAASKGWEVVGEYSDNSISAYSGAARPAYERMMADVKAGLVDVVVCWQSSRLWRQGVQRAEGIRDLAKAGVNVAVVEGPGLDLSTANGRMIAGVLGEFDTNESAVKSERIRAEIRQRVEGGRRHGPVPYGWERHVVEGEDGKPDKVETEQPDEAKVVREIADRIIDRESLSAITADLNARGVVPPSRDPEGRWHTSSVRSLMLRPANVAQNVHHGEVIGKGDWPPLLTAEQYDTVRAVLTDPKRWHGQQGRRKHLLSGDLATCGVCGGSMSSKRRKAYSFYRCDKGCVGRQMTAVDDLVGWAVVERLGREDVAGTLLKPADTREAARLRAEADTLRRRLDAAAEDYAEGLIDRQQLTTITARLRPQLDAAEDTIGRIYSSSEIGEDVLSMFGDDPAEAWEALDLTGRRNVLKALGVKVCIMPTKARGRNFNHEDVKIEWSRNAQ